MTEMPFTYVLVGLKDIIWTKTIIKKVLEVMCLVMMSHCLEESQWFTMNTHRCCRNDLWSETHSVVCVKSVYSLKAKLDVHLLFLEYSKSCEFVCQYKFSSPRKSLGYTSCLFYQFFLSCVCQFSSVRNWMTNWMGQVAVARCSCYVKSWRGGYRDTQFYVRG